MAFTFLNNIPQSAQFLDFSWTQLLANNQALDSIFGIDHYKFSNLTANQGFHNTVTTPGYVTTPPTVPVIPPVTTTNPIFYGFQTLDAGGNPTTSLGLLQFSRGPSNAIPTPLTRIHGGPLNVDATPQTIQNFAGIPRCLFTVYASDSITMSVLTNIAISGFWNGTSFIFPSQPASGSSPNVSALLILGSGTNLQISNQNLLILTGSVYFTIQLHRLQ